MNKRIVFILMMILLTLSLASCKKVDKSVQNVVINNPIGEKLVFENSQKNDIVFKGENGLSYWTVNKQALVELVEYEGNLPSIFEEDENGIRTYYFVVEGEQHSFQIYIKPEDLVPSDEVVMLAIRYSEHNFTHNIGHEFSFEDLEVYAVQKDGTVIALHETLSKEEFAALFDDGGYSPLGEKGFKKDVKYDVKISYGGISKEFNVYVIGGEKPISNKDANFFDWVFVIPISYVMAFFGNIMGYSFALAILFTTIVVRTLAWPIYAKSNDMSMKMNVAQPDLQRLQRKYATRKDPQSQQQMQMETMQIYKKHGISMFGCLFPFLQMPIFIAMFGVVRRIPVAGGMFVDAVRNTSFLGINLARGEDGIVGMILAGLVGATMFLLQWLSQKKPSYYKKTATHNNPEAAQTEKTMKYMMYFMVVMMTFTAYRSNALALYWIFGNIYSLGQTAVNKRMNEKKHAKMNEERLMG